MRAELTSLRVPRERRRFALGALGAALAMVGTPHRLRAGILAAGTALAFAAGLLGFSRATVGHDGLGSVSVLLPPVMLFAIGFGCARLAKSLHFGVETGVGLRAERVMGVREVDYSGRVHDPAGGGGGLRRRGSALVRRRP